MLQSRYFAAKYFSSRFIGGIPERETIVIPPAKPAVPGKGYGGGRTYGYDGWQHLLKDVPRRKQQDEEVLSVLAMFTILEDEDGALI